VLLRDRHDRKTRDPKKLEAGKFRVIPDLGERYRAAQGTEGSHVHAPRPPIVVGVGPGTADDLEDPHARALVPRVIEKGEVAGKHRPQVAQRERVVDTVPLGIPVLHEI